MFRMSMSPVRMTTQYRLWEHNSYYNDITVRLAPCVRCHPSRIVCSWLLRHLSFHQGKTGPIQDFGIHKVVRVLKTTSLSALVRLFPSKFLSDAGNGQHSLLDTFPITLGALLILHNRSTDFRNSTGNNCTLNRYRNGSARPPPLHAVVSRSIFSIA